MFSNTFSLTLTFFVAIVSNTLHAQFAVSGMVVDELDNPLPYATVYLEGQSCGTLTDEVGTFAFSCANAKPDSSTLVAVYLGYEARKIDLSKGTINLKISLSSFGVTLEAVEVFAKEGSPETFKFQKKRPEFYYQTNVETNYQLATEIRNSGRQGGLLTEISFFVGKAASNSIPIRLSFYATDEDCDCPGAAMHASNIFVQAKSKRNKVDLRPYNIELPAGNFFVAFEWLPTSDRRQDKLDFSIGMVSATKRMSLQERRGGLGWRKREGSGRQHILVEIDYLKF